MRGVTLEEISAATRIAPRFLAALESEQWELLPGGVFNRGFIRSVARYLGLDEDSLVAEYALETRGRTEPGVVADPPEENRPQLGASFRGDRAGVAACGRRLGCGSLSGTENCGAIAQTFR